MSDRKTEPQAPTKRFTDTTPSNGHAVNGHAFDPSRYKPIVSALEELKEAAAQVAETVCDHYGCTQDDTRPGHAQERGFLRTASSALQRRAEECLESITEQSHAARVASRTKPITADYRLADLAQQCQETLRHAGLPTLNSITLMTGASELTGAANTLRGGIMQFQQAYEQYAKTYPLADQAPENGHHTNGTNGDGRNGEGRITGSLPNGRTL